MCFKKVLACCALACSPAASNARAELLNFYVGVDGRETLTSGAYIGLPNPNHGRLTWLAYPGDHTEPSGAHFHGIGTYGYAGTPPAQTVIDTNANNRIPETHTAQLPLTLLPGDGIYSDKLVSGPASGEHYGDLTIRAVADLATYAEPTIEYYLRNSSTGRWTEGLGEAQIALELISISPGLNIGDAGDSLLASLPGDFIELGSGDELDFTPVFWTDDDAPLGTYSAEFRLHDLNGDGGRTPLDSSGTFHLDFAVVPEPATLGIAALLLVGMAPVIRSRRS